MLSVLIKKQQARPHSFSGLLIVSIFTGILRAIEEFIFFDAPLDIRVGISMIYFYFCAGFFYTVLLHKVTGFDYRRVQNIAYLGVLLGMLPPVIDLIFNGFNTSVKYSYYFLYDFEFFPWFFFSRTMNLPAGESFTVWLTILLASFYTLYLTRNIFRLIVTFIFGYLFFITVMAFIPIVILRLLSGIEITNSNMSYYVQIINYSTLLQPYAYLILLVGLFFILYPRFVTHLSKRALHITPFILINLVGSAMHNIKGYEPVLTTLTLFFIFLMALIQNDYYDRINDKGQNNRIRVTKKELEFSYIISGLLILWLIMTAQAAALPVIVIFVLTILYHHPLFRVKRFFPGAIKIEGAWGGLSFLSGTLIQFNHNLAQQTVIAFVLIAGGWSVISSLKDLKDTRFDYRNGIMTVYTFFYNKSVKLKTIHRNVSVIIFALLLTGSGLIYFTYSEYALLLLVPALTMIMWSQYKIITNWFLVTLLIIDTYLLLVYLLIKGVI